MAVGLADLRRDPALHLVGRQPGAAADGAPPVEHPFRRSVQVAGCTQSPTEAVGQAGLVEVAAAIFAANPPVHPAFRRPARLQQADAVKAGRREEASPQVAFPVFVRDDFDQCAEHRVADVGVIEAGARGMIRGKARKPGKKRVTTDGLEPRVPGPRPVDDLGRQARGVGHEVLDGNHGPRWRQPRKMRADGFVERQAAVGHEREYRAGREGLGDRDERHRVRGRHRRAPARHPLAGPLEQRYPVAMRDQYLAGEAARGCLLDDALEVCGGSGRVDRWRRHAALRERDQQQPVWHCPLRAQLGVCASDDGF